MGRHARPSARSVLFRFAAAARGLEERARRGSSRSNRARPSAKRSVKWGAPRPKLDSWRAKPAARRGQTFPSERSGIVLPHRRRAARRRLPRSVPGIFRSSTPVRKIAPALAWGNTVVFKPSSLTPWSAVYLMELLVKAGVPPGVVNLVTGQGSVVGEALIQDARVPGISFTGSTTVGRHIYEAAARRLVDGAARTGRQEPGGRHRLRRSRRRRARDRGRGVPVQRPAVHGHQPRHRRRSAGGRAGRADPCPRRPHQGRRRAGARHDDGSAGERRTAAQRRAVRPAGRRCRVRAADRRRAADGATRSRQGYYYAPTVFDRVPADSPLALEEIFGPVLPIAAGRAISTRPSRSPTARGTVSRRRCSRHAWAHIHEFTSRVAAGMIHVNHGTASQAHVPIRRRQGFRAGRLFDRVDRQRVLHECQSHLCQVVSLRRT